MKRSVKNIINIAISVLLILAIIFTGYMASKNTTTIFNDVSDSENFKGGRMNGFGDNESNEVSPNDSSEDSGDSQSTPELPEGEIQEGTMPEMPSGEAPSMGEIQEGTMPEGQAPSIGEVQEGTTPEMPSGETTDGTTPPEKPDGDTTEAPSMGEIQEGTMPEMPSGEQGEMPSTGDIQEGTMPEIPTNEDGTVPELPDDINEEDMDNFIMSNTPDNTLFNVLLIIESIGLSLSLVYLFVSKFNLISFKEVFSDKDRLIIFILVSVLLAIVLSWGTTAIVSNITSSATPDIRNINSDFADKI